LILLDRLFAFFTAVLQEISSIISKGLKGMLMIFYKKAAEIYEDSLFNFKAALPQSH